MTPGTVPSSVSVSSAAMQFIFGVTAVAMARVALAGPISTAVCAAYPPPTTYTSCSQDLRIKIANDTVIAAYTPNVPLACFLPLDPKAKITGCADASNRAASNLTSTCRALNGYSSGRPTASTEDQFRGVVLVAGQTLVLYTTPPYTYNANGTVSTYYNAVSLSRSRLIELTVVAHFVSHCTGLERRAQDVLGRVPCQPRLLL